MDKGMNLDVRDIANEIKKTKYDWAIFHTRFATMGSKSDKNCHPFIRRKYCYCHEWNRKLGIVYK